MREARASRLGAHVRFQVLAIVVLCLGVVACEMPFQEYPSDAVTVENQSSQTVRLMEVSDAGSRIDNGLLRPGEKLRTRAECIGNLVVESLDGQELAAWPGILCQGDPPWIITDDLLEND